MTNSIIKSMLKTTALRIVAFGLIFAYVLPFILGTLIGKGAFTFHGSLLAAGATACVYLVFAFSAAGIQLALLGSYEKTLRERGLWDRISSAVCFTASTAFVLVAASFLPSLLVVSSVLAAVVAGAICLAVMAGTLYVTSPCYRKKFARKGGCQGGYNGGCQGKQNRSGCQGGCGGKCKGGCQGDCNRNS